MLLELHNLQFIETETALTASMMSEAEKIYLRTWVISGACGGGGTQTRRRGIATPPSLDGKICSKEDAIETILCRRTHGVFVKSQSSESFYLHE